MIQDKECNSVYFAEYLQVMFPKMVSELKTILGKYGYEPKFIPTTNKSLTGKRLSIWVRDYMPIQRDVNDYILFDYQPDYLDKREYCGHTDGILRYLGDNKVLLNTYGYPEYGNLDIWYMNRFRKRLQPYFGKGHIEELKFEEHEKPTKYRWAYVNWLQLEKVLIIPKFDVPEDNEALNQIEKFMPDYKGKIEQVMIGKEFYENGKDLNLADLGGCLNCASWTIKE